MNSEEWNFPDIHELFCYYDDSYFHGILCSVEVRWSKKMTLCAGICSYNKEGFCSIRLSEPLLKLRPIRDLKQTLLHEMIHAYLFLTKNKKDRSDHGPEFQKHMLRINFATGLTISVYHNFGEEVNYYRTHIWKCNGPCQFRPPFYGYIRRAVNRAPGLHDPWWLEHKNNCNGSFQKISEPKVPTKVKNQTKTKKDEVDKNSPKYYLNDFFHKPHNSLVNKSNSSEHTRKEKFITPPNQNRNLISNTSDLTLSISKSAPNDAFKESKDYTKISFFNESDNYISLISPEEE